MDILTNDHIMEFHCIGYSEIDSKAEATYRSNYAIGKDEIVMGDIVAFTNDKKNIKSLPKFDLLTGGFPCQTFSMMGNQTGFDEDRGQMFFRIMDILMVKKPKYVLLENVKNLWNHDKGRTFARIKSELESIGYHVYADIFNTADFHLPQTRNRILIFATTVRIPKDFQFSAKLIAKEFDKKYKETSLLHYETVNEVLMQDAASNSRKLLRSFSDSFSNVDKLKNVGQARLMILAENGRISCNADAFASLLADISKNESLKLELVVYVITAGLDNHSIIAHLVASVEGDYHEVCNQDKRAKLPDNIQNRRLLEALKNVGFISSYKVDKDKLQIYHKIKNN